MIIWGTRGKTVNLGQAETKHCETCEKERPFSLVLQYQYFHLYWIFGMVTKRRYMLLCDVCQRGWELDTKKVRESMKKEPIPFMYKYGILGIIGVIVFFAVLAAFAGE